MTRARKAFLEANSETPPQPATTSLSAASTVNVQQQPASSASLSLDTPALLSKVK